MDIAEYIVELLQQHQVAVVPGLGSFRTTRVEGYYNKEQQLFYPPCLQAQFNPEKQEGADLVELIAAHREISPASARYFVEKYISTLKEQLLTNSVPLGSMGTFSMRRSELAFEPNSLNENYDTYYGLTPAKLKRSNDFRQEAIEAALKTTVAEPAAVAETPQPLAAEPEVATAPVAEPAAEPQPKQIPPVNKIYTGPETIKEELEIVYPEEEEAKKGVNIWVVLSIIIVFMGIGVIAVYKYQPQYFDKIIPVSNKPPVNKPVIKKTITDSLDAAIVAQHDTAAKTADTAAPKEVTPATVPTTAPVDTFGVVVASLPSAKLANQESHRYLKLGYPQTEVRKKPNSSRLYLINIGTYFNADSAKANMLKIKKELKLAPNEIRIQIYPYKKP